jgi:hypothetical protein
MKTPGTERAIAPLPWMGGIALGAIVVMTASVQAATLNNWQFDPGTQQLVITLPKGVTPQYHLAAEPARIVVDLPNTDVGTVPMQQSYSGAVRQIRIAQFQPGLARIVLELSPEAVLAPGQVELQQLDGSDGNTQRWALRPLLVTDTPSPTVAQSPVSENATISPVRPSAPIPSGAASAPVAPTPAIVSVSPAPSPAPTGSAEVAQPAASPDESATAPSSNNSENNTNHALPPLEPGAVEIPVQIEASTPESEIASAEPTEVAAETPTPTVATVPQLSAPPSLPAPAPINPAPANPIPVTPAPTAAVSAPLPVDFSRPPEPATGNAASLALPSVGQAVINPPTAPAPSSGTLSFPRPTASGVSVPPINTVVAENPAAELPTDNSAAASATDETPTTQPNAEQSSDSPPSASPLPSAAPTASPVPSAPPPTAAIPSAQPIPAQPAPTAPPSDSVIPFGQPLATSPSTPASPGASSAPTAPVPAGNTAPTAPVPSNDAIPFGQPIPTPQPSAPATREIPVIQFGQPLPGPQSSINSLPETARKPAAAVIPSGTVLKLRYAGESALSLAEQVSRQEVLLLEQSVHDQAGNLVFPAGSPVIGRFETSETGSQFIAQAVQVQGQNVVLSAQSEQLAGERQIRQNGLLRNSAIGAVAGTLLGAVTGVGLIPAVIAGAATSAATTYVTSPEAAAVIQPNQVVEVRLTQDLVQ